MNTHDEHGRHGSIDLGVQVWCAADGDCSVLEHAMHHLRQGLDDGYPLCCVLEFVEDCLVRGWHPAMRRGSVPDGSGGVYVPCTRCRSTS